MISAEERARLVYNGCDEMFSGKSWIEMPAKDFIDYTKQVQLDALREAAEIVRTFAEDHKTIQPSFTGITKAIMDRAKQLEQT